MMIMLRVWDTGTEDQSGEFNLTNHSKARNVLRAILDPVSFKHKSVFSTYSDVT